MTTLHRVVVQWSGPQVKGAAVNVLHFSGSDSGAPPVAGVVSAYRGIQGILPQGVRVTIPGVGDSINDTTGELIGTWAVGGGDFVDGITSTPNAAAGVGACVTWLTGGIINGRRLRGRTFLVPLHVSAYDGDGTLATAAAVSVQNFGTNLMAAGPLAVWHRPTTVGGSDGNSYGVTAARARDHVAYLGSRRD